MKTAIGLGERRCLLGRDAFGCEPRIVCTEARRDHAIGDEGDDYRQEKHRREREPDIRGQADRATWIDKMGSVVRELDEDCIERLDQHVDRESAGDCGEPERQTG
jgi:hypothetical protein